MAETRTISPILRHRTAQMRRRMIALAAGSGAGWAVAVAAVVLIGGMALDLLVELPSGLRLAGDLIATAAGAAVLVGWAARQLGGRGLHATAVRRLDEASMAEGQIISAMDLVSPASSSAAIAATPLTAGLAKIAIARAERLAQTARPEQALPIAPLYRPLNLLLPLAAGLVLLAILSPRLVRTQWLRFAHPFADHPPYSTLTFRVSPGDTQVVYGGTLEINATVDGGAVDEVEAVLRPDDGSPPQQIPMFRQLDGRWQAILADVKRPLHYSVHARRARSREFAASVLTIPQIRDVRFRITPPPYTHRPPYEGPMPQGGIAGLPGTVVQVWANSNRPLSGGRFEISAIRPESQSSTQPAASTSGSLGVAAPGADEAIGSFAIAASGRLWLTLTDVGGQSSSDIFTAPIRLLHDDRPTIRLIEPRATSIATPDVTIEAAVEAEDDYGLSRLQLFHDVNETSTAIEEIALPATEPVRWPAKVPLSLAKLKVKPGDLVRVYARAQDNDPSGPKGAESPIATVRIISQQEMDRLQLAQAGAELLKSKYDQADQRLAALDQQIGAIQKQLSKLDPQSAVASEQHEQLEQLAAEMDRHAEELEHAAQQDLPLDIDHALKQHLRDVASKTGRAAAEARRLAQQPGLSVSGLDNSLAQMREQLGEAKEKFDQQATDPLEHLAQIYPLKEDEARFIQLAQQQRDLSERMRSLNKPGNDPDDATNKARTRDMEDEQRQLKDELNRLLGDVDGHVAQLPEDPKLDPLRTTAKDFVRGVRGSPAEGQMADAQQALGERNLAAAEARSREAAKTLDGFLSRCQSMGDGASAALKFQPQLAQGLGDTVDQLLDAAGLKPGSSFGTGRGGGYSARRNSMSNIGIYGRLPLRSSASSSRGGKNSRGISVDGSGPPEASDEPFTVGTGTDPRIAGEAAAAVPPQYRDRVGDYFRRVADELGDLPPATPEQPGR